MCLSVVGYAAYAGRIRRGEFNTRPVCFIARSTVNWKHAAKTTTATSTPAASLKQPTLVRRGLVVAKLSRNDNSQANGGAGFGSRRRAALTPAAAVKQKQHSSVLLKEM